MQVILKTDIEKIGFQYEEIKVKPGFARNYLIPKGYAVLATTSEKKQLQETLRQRSKKEEVLLKKAKETVNSLKSINIKISVKAGEKGKIFGSVNNQVISEALKEKHIHIEKKFIIIPGNNIKKLGKHKVKIFLHRRLELEFPFELVG
ncbi:50S ribosomal protein L9 [Candidatus Uzinura diaspidicola str. ASNER]|uniref:Large ribosomal subunit protein bL9 n=1 Tax=Candidatus Uzinura diaspidicola str. ASNER TaxID=1133592 RepID=L7VGB0_9FLAO|nr:50S ribosomal protein L9 [Candidatus Uzinura diaspidicola str. ASNER]